jgi:hypothetical protein
VTGKVATVHSEKRRSPFTETLKSLTLFVFLWVKRGVFTPFTLPFTRSLTHAYGERVNGSVSTLKTTRSPLKSQTEQGFTCSSEQVNGIFTPLREGSVN